MLASLLKSISGLALLCLTINWCSASSSRQTHWDALGGDGLQDTQTVRLVDNAGSGEACFGIRIGRAGWVLTNLHCIERSLLERKLMRSVKLVDDVRYLEVSPTQLRLQLELTRGMRGIPLEQVQLPDVSDPGSVSGFGEESVQLFAAGRGYPILSDVERVMRSAPTNIVEGIERQLAWKSAGTQLPLQDFALLRVRGLKEEEGCLDLSQVASPSTLHRGEVLLPFKGGWRSGQLKAWEIRSLPSYERWAPFLNYVAASGLFFTDLNTEPGHSGLPIYGVPDSAKRETSQQDPTIVALHSFGSRNPSLSAEIPLHVIWKVLLPQLMEQDLVCSRSSDNRANDVRE